MSHSHQTSADFHGPTEGTSEAGEAKNVTCGWEASAAHVGLSELIRSLTAGSPLPCLSGPEHIFIYKPEANAVCTLALITTGVLHRLRKLKQTQAVPEHRTGWVSSAAACGLQYLPFLLSMLNILGKSGVVPLTYNLSMGSKRMSQPGLHTESQDAHTRHESWAWTFNWNPTQEAEAWSLPLNLELLWAIQ